jgi:hypothetical protein
MTRNGFVTGAYGLRIEGLDEHESLRVRGPVDWPRVSVTQRVAERSDAATELGDRHSVFQLLDTELRIDRDRREALFVTDRPFSLEELVHPYLAPVGNVFARWDARETLHAGAFVVDGGAWAVLGEKGAGKSTTLAWLAAHGIEVVADDIVVLDGGVALAGPRCIDVRDDASEHLAAGVPASVTREGGRNRMPLPPIAAEIPLGGFVYLEWGEGAAVERVPPAARLARLQPQRQAARLHSDPVEQLDLAALPAYVLGRAAGLDRLDAAGEALLAAVRA